MTHYSDDLYTRITDILTMSNDKNAAEGHGILCGLYCATGTINYLLWEQEVTGSSELDEESRDVLADLYAQTCEQLDNQDFSFSLLLPSDKQALEKRTAALGYWCQGFYFGLLLGGSGELMAYSQEVREFTQDITEIAQISRYQLHASEQDEKAYMELVEYVRAGVQLTKEELDPTHQQRTLN